MIADGARPWPLRTASMDGVMMSWFLYIVRDAQVALQEAARVLRLCGRLVLATPLVYPPNPEPGDYWRF